MKVSLTTDEMLEVWRLHRALLPLREDCVVERQDGIYLDKYLQREMRNWYLDLLDTGPIEMLKVTDIADETVVRPNADGSASVTLPERCRRVLEVKLSGWERPARIVDPAELPVVSWQQNPYSMGHESEPVAINDTGTLQLYSIPDGVTTPRLESLKCIIEPDEGLYVLDERAFSLIPKPTDL